jgi:hypothetical protein
MQWSNTSVVEIDFADEGDVGIDFADEGDVGCSTKAH